MTKEHPELQGAADLFDTLRSNRITDLTTKRYVSQIFNHVIPFLQKYTATPYLPITDAQAALFISYRFNESGTLYAPTIGMQAINYWHRREGYQELTAQPLQDFVNGARRMLGGQVKHTTMAKPEWIRKLLDYCDRPEATAVERRLGNVASLMLGYCSRGADCLNVTRNCIKPLAVDHKIEFWDTKTDKDYRIGHLKTCSKLQDAWGICDRLEKYLRELGLWDIPPSHPLSTSHIFLPAQYLHSTGTSTVTPAPFAPAVSKAAIDDSFRKVRALLQLPDEFTLHGIRVFVATTSLQDDIPIEQIKRSGNWVSSAIEMYLEPSAQQQRSTSEATSRAYPHSGGSAIRSNTNRSDAREVSTTTVSPAIDKTFAGANNSITIGSTVLTDLDTADFALLGSDFDTTFDEGNEARIVPPPFWWPGDKSEQGATGWEYNGGTLQISQI